MVSSTFGYDKREDRVWLSFDDGTPRLWFTRRLVSHLLGPMLGPFEAASPGGQGGAQASTRVALEHELAMNELLPGERALPMKMGTESASESQNAEHELCTGLNASFDASQCHLRFSTVDGERSLQMGRVSMHRWLRGLHLLVQHGATHHDGHGALLKSVSKSTRRRLQALLPPKQYAQAERWFGVYAVLSPDRAVVTAAHRTHRRHLH